MDIVDNFGYLCNRVGQMLMGDCSVENESEFFYLLLFAEKGMFMSTEDGLGSSESMEFDLELNDKYVKPVCHEPRKYNKIKLDFIDREVDKMLELGVIEPYLGEWSSSPVVVAKPGPG